MTPLSSNTNAANNRTSGSDDPLNKLTTNIPSALKTNRTTAHYDRYMINNGSGPQFTGSHNKSL